MDVDRVTLRRRLAGAALVAAAALSAAACGDGGGTGPRASAPSESTPAPSEATPTTPSATTAAAEGIPLTTGDSDYGPMLFDQPGQAIYLFDKETAGRPDCYGDCASAWPPVLTSGSPQAVGGVRADLLGTVPRDDGSTQVTYAGHPLYYYAHEGPGEVLCHDVVEFGGRWLVVTPAGTPAP
jgi:predicted lipoprotein with Yx(FWY)xxD motif